MRSTQKKQFTLALQVAIAVILIGMLFTVQHWPYGRLIMSIGFVAVILFYCLRYTLKNNKELVDHIKLIFVSFWSLNGIFTVFHLPYRPVFQFLAGISFLIWFYLEGTSYFKRDFSPYLFVSAVVFVILGSMLKIMHWPGAGILLTLGFIIALVWVFKDRIFKNKVEEK